MDQPGELRRRALGAIWGAVLALVGTLAVRWSEPTAADIPAAVILTGLIALLAYWPNLRGSRVEYDPSTPLVLASAIAVSPDFAPLLLVVQAVVITVIDWVSHRRSLSHVFINAGVFSLWHGALGFMIQRQGVAMSDSRIHLAIGLLIVTTLAVMLNNLTVAATTAYLYGGQLDRLDLGLTDQARDIGTSVLLGLAISEMPGPDWAEATAFVAVLLYGLFYAERYREHRAALILETQARVAAYEAQGPLPQHSERVSDLVGRLASLHGHSGEFAEIVAWAHSLHVEARLHLCSGVDASEYVRSAMLSLPRMRRADRMQPVGGLPREGADPLTHLVAAACAWDSRRLPGSPIRTPDDLVYTFGIDRSIVDRVVDIDPIWVTHHSRRLAGTSKPR